MILNDFRVIYNILLKKYSSMLTFMYLYLSVSSVSITPAARSVVAGDSISLTCSGTIVGRGIPLFMCALCGSNVSNVS